RSENIHFARFVFIRSDVSPLGQRIGASLMYIADFDSAVDDHLAELADIATTELTRLGAHLKDAIPADPTAQLAWLRRHIIENATYYVNTIGRTLRQIRCEADLRRQIEGFLDGANTGSSTPAALRPMVQNFVL